MAEVLISFCVTELNTSCVAEEQRTWLRTAEDVLDDLFCRYRTQEVAGSVFWTGDGRGRGQRWAGFGPPESVKKRPGLRPPSWARWGPALAAPAQRGQGRRPIQGRVEAGYRIDAVAEETIIPEFREDDLGAIVEFSLRAWEPVFGSVRNALGDDIFLRLHPDWKEG